MIGSLAMADVVNVSDVSLVCDSPASRDDGCQQHIKGSQHWPVVLLSDEEINKFIELYIVYFAGVDTGDGPVAIPPRGHPGRLETEKLVDDLIRDYMQQKDLKEACAAIIHPYRPDICVATGKVVLTKTNNNRHMRNYLRRCCKYDQYIPPPLREDMRKCKHLHKMRQKTGVSREKYSRSTIGICKRTAKTPKRTRWPEAHTAANPGAYASSCDDSVPSSTSAGQYSDRAPVEDQVFEKGSFEVNDTEGQPQDSLARTMDELYQDVNSLFNIDINDTWDESALFSAEEAVPARPEAPHTMVADFELGGPQAQQPCYFPSDIDFNPAGNWPHKDMLTGCTAERIAELAPHGDCTGLGSWCPGSDPVDWIDVLLRFDPEDLPDWRYY